MTADRQHILLTGLPGCGKTTVVQRVVQQLDERRLTGFYTREMRHNGRRVGFEAVGLHGQTALLAHVDSPSPARVGKYGVELAGFEELVRTELSLAGDEADLVVIDEIGKMECFSQMFVNEVRRILDDRVPLLATVAQKGGGFIREVKQRPGVELVTVTPANREVLPADIAGHLLH